MKDNYNWMWMGLHNVFVSIVLYSDNLLSIIMIDLAVLWFLITTVCPSINVTVFIHQHKNRQYAQSVYTHHCSSLKKNDRSETLMRIQYIKLILCSAIFLVLVGKINVSPPLPWPPSILLPFLLLSPGKLNVK